SQKADWTGVGWRATVLRRETRLRIICWSEVSGSGPGHEAVAGELRETKKLGSPLPEVPDRAPEQGARELDKHEAAAGGGRGGRRRGRGQDSAGGAGGRPP